MGSRLMHFAIAKEISKSVEVRDYNGFILGNLLPDLSNKSDDSYGRTHFGEVCGLINKRGINWNRYAVQYRREILSSDLYLGYFAHLVTDGLWLKNIQEKYYFSLEKGLRADASRKQYADMRAMNHYFIQHYNLQDGIQIQAIPFMERLSTQDVSSLLAAIHEDFEGATDQLGLNFYKLKDITSFMDEVVLKCILEIDNLKEGHCLGNDQDFYIDCSLV